MSAADLVLRPITRDNWRAVADLQVHPEQQPFVTPVSRYLCLCLYDGVWNPVGGYDGDQAVCFGMWGYDTDDGSYWIGGLVVPAELQGKGFGRALIRELISLVKARPDCRTISISYQGLYASMGFVETGEVDGDEVIARLKVG